MARIAGMLFLLALPGFCSAQEKPSLDLNLVSPYWSKPHTKTDAVWSVVKPLGFVAAELDAWSTAQQIKRGYVESNAMDNALIKRNDPALGGRSALQHGETYGVNMMLQLVYNKCGTSRLCKWTVIGARGYFIGRSLNSTVHNMRLP
jgi:hypothetical protein